VREIIHSAKATEFRARPTVLKLAYNHGIYEVYVQTRPEEMTYDRDPGNRKMADYALLKAEVERILTLMRDQSR
jgi:hypothetical protein